MLAVVNLLVLANRNSLQSWTKVLGQFPLYPLPPPPISMLIFRGGENADESIDGSNISRLSGGGGGGGGSKKCTKRTRCVSVIRVEVCVLKFSGFRPSLLSVPKSYDQDCRSLKLMTNCCYIKILSPILVKEVHVPYETLFICSSENHVLSEVPLAVW